MMHRSMALICSSGRRIEKPDAKSRHCHQENISSRAFERSGVNTQRQSLLRRIMDYNTRLLSRNASLALLRLLAPLPWCKVVMVLAFIIAWTCRPFLERRKNSSFEYASSH